MRKHLALAAGVALVLGVAVATSPASASERFRASLSGDAEAPGVETNSRGQAQFWTSEGGDVLHYRLIVANLDDVIQAHIHIAPEGSNGPVVVFLFGPADPPMRQSGVLAEGEITASDLIPRDGFDATMEALLDRLRNGGAYVNVHTVAHMPGEIRGQIAPVGKR